MENINFSTEFKKFVNDVDSSGFDEKIKEMQAAILSDTGYVCKVDFLETVLPHIYYISVMISAYHENDNYKNFYDIIKLSVYDPEAVSTAKIFIERNLLSQIHFFYWKQSQSSRLKNYQKQYQEQY